MAVKALTEAVEQREPTLLDMISSAKKAEDIAAQFDAQQKEAAQQLQNAKAEAKAAWDALYNELLKLKADNQTSEAFKSSKLGQLLNQAR